MEKLQRKGVIPKGDAEAAEATKQALTLVRSPGCPKERRLMAQRLLAHYHPELREKSNGR